MVNVSNLGFSTLSHFITRVDGFLMNLAFFLYYVILKNEICLPLYLLLPGGNRKMEERK